MFPGLTWRRKPTRTITYGLAAILLGAGAPLGYLLLRWLIAGAPLRARWLAEEVQREWITYAYLEIATSIVFLILARILGRAADALEAASRIDPLTGLSNRGHLEETLLLELQRARRFGMPVAFLLVDVDHLKALNDERGHEGGDEALRAVAAALDRSRRATDVAGRWGGDEFALIAPGATAASALHLAERLRDALGRSETKLGKPPTVSIGITDDTIARSHSAHALYASADKALYDAKARGRDRAIVARPSDGALTLA